MSHSTQHPRVNSRPGLSPRIPPPPAHSTQVLPPDPQAMLMVQQQKRRSSWLPRPNLLVLVLAGGITAEVMAPMHLQPSFIAGKAAANFYGQIMDESNRKELDLGEQKPIAEAIGERERLVPHINGLCAASAWIDPQIAHYCRGMANSYFAEALPPGPSYRQHYRDRFQ